MKNNVLILWKIVEEKDLRHLIMNVIQLVQIILMKKIMMVFAIVHIFIIII